MKKFIGTALMSWLVILFFSLSVRLIMFPELYITTWKQALYNDLKRGNIEAVEYYQTTYINHGIKLFEDIER